MNTRLPHLFDLLKQAEAELSVFKDSNPLRARLRPARAALEIIHKLSERIQPQDPLKVVHLLHDALDAVQATSAAATAPKALEALYRLRFGIERALAALNATDDPRKTH